MATPAHSFDIRTPEQFFQAFLETVADYLADPLSRKAVAAAMFGWHLCDWVVNAYGGTRADLKRRCPSLRLLEDICNGSKHFQPDAGAKVVGTDLRPGAFSSGFDRGYEIPYLPLSLADGSVRDFEDVINDVRDFWARYFQERTSVGG